MTDDRTAWIIDGDGHVMEPLDIWDRFLPGQFRSLAPYFHDEWKAMLYAIPGGTDPTDHCGSVRRLSSSPSDCSKSAARWRMTADE
jgi:hypothetical protein